MKPHQILALIAILLLPSCNGLTIFGKSVALVNDRNADGTFKPTKDVLHPVTGETPIGSGRIYVYPHGDVAVSASGTGAKTLKLKSL